MRVPLFLFFVLSISTIGNAQEKYFHDLRGMEDSTGTTHLFYRIYETNTFQCSEENGGHTLHSRKNNVYHMEPASLTDTLKFSDFYEPWCLDGFFSVKRIVAYTFIDNNPNNFIVHSTGDYCASSLETNSEKFFPIYSPCVIKTIPDLRSFTWGSGEIIYVPTKESFYVSFLPFDSHLKLSTKIDDWPIFEEIDFFGFEDSTGKYFEYVDSLSIHENLLAINPGNDSVYYARSENHEDLLISNDNGNEFSTTNLQGKVLSIDFGANAKSVYSIVGTVINNVHTRMLKISDNYGQPESWSKIDLPSELITVEHLTTDTRIEGQLFISDSKQVFQSVDNGKSFNLLAELTIPIQGLYKKPDSNLLYVLTRDKLLKINIQSMERKVLKILPVSNESEPEVPSIITLHQNYPNPFNPSTKISYQLMTNSHIKLKIFDSLGREVAMLENGLKSAGNHIASFNANNLSSGIYYYVLDAEDLNQRFVKKMTLIK